ncbi:MAG TPA: hypothetical protein VKR79_06105 [Gaiellaceae bacterium]|nr:hypothetical protein [Gaiellaceae bacterium]
MGEAAGERVEYYGGPVEQVAEIQSMATVVHRLPTQTRTSASPSIGRVVTWLAVSVVAVVAVALVWFAVPRFDGVSFAPGSLAGTKGQGFADGRFPVRAIQHAPDLASGKRDRLVRVQCAGRARHVSLCWVARTGRHS